MNPLQRSRFSSIFAGLLALLCARPAHAQLFVDAGGARDIFYDSKMTGLQSSVDSSAESASLTYFNKLAGGAPLLAFKGTATATDGLDQFLKFTRAPNMSLSVLANWQTEEVESTVLSYTPSITATYAEDDLVNPSSSTVPIPITRRDVFTGEFNNTISAIVPWGDSVAFSFAVKRDNNYTSLPKVTTGGSLSNGTRVASSTQVTTARVGTLSEYTDFPLFVTYVHEFGGEWVTNSLKTLESLHIIKSANNSTGTVLLGPYFKETPRDGGFPTHAVGGTLTLSLLSNSQLDANGIQSPTKGKMPSDQVLSFPYSFFVEYGTNASTGKGSTTAGVQAIFQWK